MYYFLDTYQEQVIIVNVIEETQPKQLNITEHGAFQLSEGVSSILEKKMYFQILFVTMIPHIFFTLFGY